jgi:hypothetical protein
MAKAETETQWEVVSENRARIVFDTTGDTWEGFYEGPQTITDPNTQEEYEYLNFRDDTGEGYMVSASYQLSRAFAEMAPGTYVKLIVTGFTDTKRGKMTNFKVLARR